MDYEIRMESAKPWKDRLTPKERTAYDKARRALAKTLEPIEQDRLLDVMRRYMALAQSRKFEPDPKGA